MEAAALEEVCSAFHTGQTDIGDVEDKVKDDVTTIETLVVTYSAVVETDQIAEEQIVLNA